MSRVILVVEDNLLIQSVVEEALIDAGCGVRVASTANEALQALNLTGTDIAVLLADIDLPPGRLTGWDVAQQARKTMPELPVIYMTGASGGDWPSKGVIHSTLITKPFTPEQIVEGIAQILDGTSV